MTPSSHLLVFAGLGIAIMIVAWLPLWLERLPLSLPMLAVGIGYVVFLLTLNAASPLVHPELVELTIEIALIVAVMGAGLSIDRRFAWRLWGSSWRLLAIVMPLSVLALAALGYGLLGLPLGMAVLLAGILAPTDPVLAASVQVGPPGTGEEGETRFALTSEAGLNDGMALPFVTLGLVMISHDTRPAGWFGEWLLVDVAWKIAAAAAIGFLLGWLTIRLNALLPKRFQLSSSNEGLVSVGLAFLVYSAAEEARSYGFIAIFTAAVTLRNFGRSVEYARRMNESARSIERVLAFLVLALLGGAVAGGVLAPIGWAEVLFALGVLIVVRPAATLIGFIGSPQPWPVRLAAGYFGIRGLGSLYYMTYAENSTRLDRSADLWGVVSLTVLFSIVLYGVTADPIMGWLDRRIGKLDGNRRRTLETADIRSDRAARDGAEHPDRRP